jgi:hypothetical protein
MVDFDAILRACGESFGEPVYYYTALTGPIALTAVFNDRYQETKLQDGIEVVGTSIVLGIRAALFPVQPVQSELFRIRGVLYVIANPPEPDGLGDLKITLRAATDAESSRMRLPPGSL